MNAWRKADASGSASRRLIAATMAVRFAKERYRFGKRAERGSDLGVVHQVRIEVDARPPAGTGEPHRIDVVRALLERLHVAVPAPRTLGVRDDARAVADALSSALHALHAAPALAAIHEDHPGREHVPSEKGHPRELLLRDDEIALRQLDLALGEDPRRNLDTPIGEMHAVEDRPHLHRGLLAGDSPLPDGIAEPPGRNQFDFPFPPNATQPSAATEPAAATELPVTGACPAITMADMQGVAPGAWPQQYEVAEFEAAANCTMTFTGRAEFDRRLAETGHLPEGNVPPVEERLPEEPLVVVPYDEIGQYGGRFSGVSVGPEAGNSEWLSVRHVNPVRFLYDLQTIVPNMAKSYEWTSDYTELTVTLRRGYRWSDGAPFTTEDIVFWWEDIMTNKDLFPEVPSYWVYGGEPMQVEAVDDVTVKFKFAAPAPAFTTLLATTFTHLWAPKHYLQDLHIKYNPDADEDAKTEGFESWQARLIERTVMPQVEHSFELARVAYASGEGDFSEMLDAQRLLLASQIEWVETRAGVARARATLDRVAGAL